MKEADWCWGRTYLMNVQGRNGREIVEPLVATVAVKMDSLAAMAAIGSKGRITRSRTLYQGFPELDG